MSNENNEEEPVWIKPNELYEKFNIALSTQAKYRITKRIPYHKIGSKIFYKLSEINAWIDNAKVN